MKVGWLLLGVAGYFGYKYISTGSQLLKLDITPGAIRRVVIKLLGSKIYFDLNIYNPGQKAISIQQITADVVLANNIIGNFDIRKEITIEAGKTASLQNIEVLVSNLTVLQTILKLVNNSGEYQEFTVRGKVKGNNLLFPFDESSEFKVPKANIETNVPMF